MDALLSNKLEVRKMKLLRVAVVALFLLASTSPCLSQVASGRNSQTISITRKGSRQSSQASGQNFTGSVRIEPVFDAHDPSRSTGGRVTFEPGARTAWHTHPHGQTLIVTAGTGWIQQWGGPIEEIREGDAVWIPPGIRHWHGATASTSMTHIGIQESLDGKTVEWMEQV